jgi:uncharacterized protein Usg
MPLLVPTGEDLERLLLANVNAKVDIVYRLPDAPSLLQEFMWETHDLHPEFPRIRKFLNFWRREIDGPIHTWQVAWVPLVSRRELRYANSVMLH